ncbi:MAG TPA: hypothetical protein VHP12_09795, partial [Chitinophagaceae bacterium]|nr:hypothetical protein [Chitinophagaceae bacterium]
PDSAYGDFMRNEKELNIQVKIIRLELSYLIGVPGTGLAISFAESAFTVFCFVLLHAAIKSNVAANPDK